MNPLFERAKARGVDPKTLLALEQFEADVTRDPNDEYAYANIGRFWHFRGEYAKALDHYNTAIRLVPCFAYALCARADLRSTCPDPVFRDGESAVRDATEAVNVARDNGEFRENWLHRMYLRVLAAAYAEAGNFTVAIETEQEALAFAITKSAISKINHHLAKYGLREPIRDEHGVIQYRATQRAV